MPPAPKGVPALYLRLTTASIKRDFRLAAQPLPPPEAPFEGESPEEAADRRARHPLGTLTLTLT